jgi:YVTN family beta-propeller protein
MNSGRFRILATLMSLSLCACGGGGGGGTSQSSSAQSGSSGSSGSSSNPVPAIVALFPSCVPAGEPSFQLSVIGPYPNPPPGLVAASVVRWNGSDRPTTASGAVNSVNAQIPASDIAAPGTAVVTVFNPAPGGGSSNSLTFTITPGAVDPQAIAVDPNGKFAYALNNGCAGGTGGYVSMYTINPATGVLTSIGPPVSTYDEDVGSMAIDPSGKFAYVTNPGDPWSPDYGSVAMYTIDATSGALTYTGSITGNCPGLCFPTSVAVDPSGKFAYAVSDGFGDFPSNVQIYTIDATTGALKSIGAITADAGAVAVDPSGKFAYVANSGSNDVSMYTISATTGALTSIGTIAAGTDPVAVAVDPSGKFAYVVNENYGSAGSVSMYTINATTGALASIGTIAPGSDPVAVTVDPSGKFAYVANSGSNDVSMYTISATTGALTSIGTIAAGTAPTSVAVDPSGKFAYVTNSSDDDVSIYGIGSSGALTLISTIGT